MKINVRTDKAGTNQVSEDSKASSGRVFFSGVMVLTFSTILVKIIGVFYKIPMLRFLGAEGMGYFNAAYEWYALLCVISTAGLPVATSMLIARARSAQDDGWILRLERLSFWVFFSLGLGGAVALFFGAEAIAEGIGSPPTRLALMAISPTLFFSCLSGAYRGFFQGFENMVPTALSQLIEALGKLIFGVGFGVYAWHHGMTAPQIAAWALLGLSFGVAISVIYLIAVRSKFHLIGETGTIAEAPHTNGEKAEAPLRALIRLALPITLSSVILCLTKIVDMTMILRRLQDIGYDTAQANALYGSYTTMAVPIFNLVPSLLNSVALALIPTLSAQIRADDRDGQRETARNAVRLTVLFSMPATIAIALYSRPILEILFHGENAAIDTSAPLLSILALSIFFSGLITTTNAILQAYGWVKFPIYSMLIGSAVKLVCAYFFIGLPSFNILGAPISTFLCNAIIVGINLLFIAKRADVLDSPASFLPPLFISVLSVGVPGFVYSLLSRRGDGDIALFVAVIPLTILLFFVLSLRTNLLEENDLKLLPGKIGERLMRIVARLKIKKKGRTF